MHYELEVCFKDNTDHKEIRKHCDKLLLHCIILNCLRCFPTGERPDQ